MSSVIKAADSSQIPLGAVYNLDDFARHGEALLRTVRERAAAQAAEMLAKAKADAERIRQEAEAAGRKAAKETFNATVAERVKQQVAEQVKSLLPALNAAIESVRHEKHAWMSGWESQVVRLATKIAERVIRRELATSVDIPLALVRESLELAAASPDVRLLLNPDDHAALGGEVDGIVAEYSRLVRATVVADASVSRGGCRVETRHGVIDQRIESQLARIEEELT